MVGMVLECCGREKFVGRGGWQVVRSGSYGLTRNSNATTPSVCDVSCSFRLISVLLPRCKDRNLGFLYRQLKSRLNEDQTNIPDRCVTALTLGIAEVGTLV
jgi:hypothetical protein